MTEIIRQKLNASRAARWTVLVLVAFTMFCAYFITDVMSPLMDMLSAEFGWTPTEYGIFNSAYGWINVFLFMLIIGGMILDKVGVRITGLGSCILMIIGCAIKYYAVANPEVFTGTVFGIKTQVITACVGFAIFATGIEMIGITVSKVIVRWFTGYEMALAMGLEMAMARLGTALAFGITIPMVGYFHSISMPILIGLFALCIGLLSFLVFCMMDKKLDASDDTVGKEVDPEEQFQIKGILEVAANKGFWLLALLCVLFYSAIFPFLKYATSLVINKYGLDPKLAGLIPLLLPLGNIILTPIFGYIYDKKGKGTTIMIIGSVLLITVHLLFSIPALNAWWFAAVLTIILGVAFSMVPSAMWPSVPKIIPQRQLGTAYGLIFWVQNIGLSMVPLLIGWILDKYCIIGTAVNADGKVTNLYDFQLPMLVFASFGVLALIVAFMLKAEDKKKGYGLEKPNIKA